MAGRVSRLDVRSAFLQTGHTARDVYVQPPRASSYRGKVLWLLLTAAYVLNPNAKWRVPSDALMFNTFFNVHRSYHNSFSTKKKGCVVKMLAKLVDNLHFPGFFAMTTTTIDLIEKRFELGAVPHGPGLMRFFGLSLEQKEDMTIITNADDKVNAMESYAPSRIRSQRTDDGVVSI